MKLTATALNGKNKKTPTNKDNHRCCFKRTNKKNGNMNKTSA